MNVWVGSVLVTTSASSIVTGTPTPVYPSRIAAGPSCTLRFTPMPTRSTLAMGRSLSSFMRTSCACESPAAIGANRTRKSRVPSFGRSTGRSPGAASTSCQAPLRSPIMTAEIFSVASPRFRTVTVRTGASSPGLRNVGGNTGVGESERTRSMPRPRMTMVCEAGPSTSPAIACVRVTVSSEPAADARTGLYVIGMLTIWVGCRTVLPGSVIVNSGSAVRWKLVRSSGASPVLVIVTVCDTAAPCTSTGPKSIIGLGESVNAPVVEVARRGSVRCGFLLRLLFTVSVACIMPARLAGSTRTVTSRSWVGVSVCGRLRSIVLVPPHVAGLRIRATVNSPVTVPAAAVISRGLTICTGVWPVLVMQNVRSSVASKRRLPKSSIGVESS
jgi:hypothetical protein